MVPSVARMPTWRLRVRPGVAAQNHQVATLGEEVAHRLPCELIHHLERARTIGRTGIVAQIDEVVVRQQLAYAV